MVITANMSIQAAVPHQDIRNLSCLAWFSSPRGTSSTTFRREMKQQTRRISHGSVRAIEDLRGLRLPLVSAPYTYERVLQTMRDKA
jgi:hypothetical protein